MDNQAVKPPQITTIGDSHGWHGWLKIPGVEVLTRGPMTMHSVGRDQIVYTKGLPYETPVVFSWGEVDCRCHIHNHQPWKETIERVVREYIKTVLLNAAHVRQIWLFNISPPPRVEDCKETYDGVGFPFVGSNEDRLKYVRYMNELLGRSPFPLIDVYESYCDSDGFMADGNVHISNEKPIMAWIEKQLGVKYGDLK
jgi:hypothetical protein